MRRLVLVGVAVIVSKGSMVQLVLATVFSLIYLTMQLQIGPYKRISDDGVAISSTFSLAVLFFSSVILKFASLTEQVPSSASASPSHPHPHSHPHLHPHPHRRKSRPR